MPVLSMPCSCKLPGSLPDVDCGLEQGTEDERTLDEREVERQLMRDLRVGIAALQMKQERLVQRFAERLRQQLRRASDAHPGEESGSRASEVEMGQVLDASLGNTDCEVDEVATGLEGEAATRPSEGRAGGELMERPVAKEEVSEAAHPRREESDDANVGEGEVPVVAYQSTGGSTLTEWTSDDHVCRLNGKFSFQYFSTKKGEVIRTSMRRFRKHRTGSRIEHLEARNPLVRWAWRVYYFFLDVKQPPPEGPVARIVCSNWFEALTLIMVMINGALIVYQANLNALAAVQDQVKLQSNSSWSWDYVLENLFSAYFTIEVAARMYVHRQYFFLNKDWCWNLFDFLAIAVTIPEMAMTLAGASSGTMDVDFLRILRVFRMTRSFRMLRALHMVQNLRRLIECIASSMSEIFWCFTLVLFITGIFGTFLCQSVTAFLLDTSTSRGQDEELERLISHFGSVPSAMFTLFKATSGGNDWGEYFDSVANVGTVASIIFVIYILFFLIAAWNIVTSLFIEKVLDIAQPDLEKQLLMKRRQDLEDAEDLMRLLQNVDWDQSGTISLPEFKRVMAMPKLLSFFELRNIDIKDAEMVFHMLEAATGTTEIDIKTVVSGLMHLRGMAMNIDLQTLQFQLQVQKDVFDKRLLHIGDQLGSIVSVLSMKGLPSRGPGKNLRTEPEPGTFTF